MTRAEFDEIDNWYDLKDFDNEIECYYCEDIIHRDDFDEMVNEEIVDAIRDCSWYWQDILCALREIPQGYDFYIRNGTLDYVYADDDDFERYKDDVCEYAERHGDFDDDEEEDDLEDEDSVPKSYPGTAIQPEDEGSVEQENISITDLFTAIETPEPDEPRDIGFLYEAETNIA
jgi:hypothetical protein